MEQLNKLQLFNLSNGVMDVVLCNYGCTIVAMQVPDRNGQKKNVVAGFKTIEVYQNNPNYLGCTVGRYANRIAFGKFELDGTEYQLECNNGVNHLHGGINAFHKKVWKVEETADGIKMHYLSKDGEEGYPGNLNVSVKYSFEANNKFVIAYTAITDKSTIINLTNHSYFNLSGFEDATIYNHVLKINAENYTPKNENNIPSGEIRPVTGTPYDFRNPKCIGKYIDDLVSDMGYDINYVLNKTNEEEPCAVLYEPASGRKLNLYTTMPGLQLYTANWWNGTEQGAQHKMYEKHGAVALETQSFPDAPNHPEFPNVVLHPAVVYSNKTVFQFDTE